MRPIYGIWCKSHRDWIREDGFELGDRRFTVYRGIAITIMNDWSRESATISSDLVVRVLGDDGLPVLHDDEDEADDILIDEALPRLPLTTERVKWTLKVAGRGNPDDE